MTANYQEKRKNLKNKRKGKKKRKTYDSSEQIRSVSFVRLSFTFLLVVLHQIVKDHMTLNQITWIFRPS